MSPPLGATMPPPLPATGRSVGGGGTASCAAAGTRECREAGCGATTTAGLHTSCAMPLEAPKSLRFTGTAVRTQGKKKKQYGVYIMECTDRDGNTWTVEKRFSEFAALKKALIKDKCIKVKQMESLPHGQGRFPKKGAKSADPLVQAERKGALDLWMRLVLKEYAENLSLCAFFKEVAAIKRDVGVGQQPAVGNASTEPRRRRRRTDGHHSQKKTKLICRSGSTKPDAGAPEAPTST